METPSSTRRITRSLARAALKNNGSSSNDNTHISSPELSVAKSRQRKQDRNALVDITNDSPIVGVAMETPSSLIMKLKSSRASRTPGSGEALLRGQVKTLLQKVEEEAEVSKIGLEKGPFLRFVNSPMGLLAPTPMNTPLVSSVGSVNGSSLPSGVSSPVVEEQSISQMVSDIMDGKHQQNLDSSIITRSLLLDFSEKSEKSSDLSECSSVLTCQGGSAESEYREKPSSEKPSLDEDDNSSIWSIQANASTNDEYDEAITEEVPEKHEEDYYEADNVEEEEDGEGLPIDELCNGMSNISISEMKLPKFDGKHTRFVYNSDDEIIEEEVEGSCESVDSSAQPNTMHLKGMPTPKGKHLRFSLDEEVNC